MFDKKKYAHQWYIDNKEKILERNKQWRKNNLKKYKEYRKKYMKQYRIDHKERIAESSKIRYSEWIKKNKEYRKKYNNKYQIKRYKIDIKFNLNHKISTAIRLSLKGNKNGRYWESLVGYTLNKLFKHLKKTMPKNYCWNDFLQGRLHIDHIIPKSVFNYTQPEHIDFKRCWALKNLQLLPAEENYKKNNKIYKSFQPALKI